MILLGLLIISLRINLVESAAKSSTALDCTKRNSDGLYGRGCSSKFLRCYNGKRFVYMCPDNLKFNVETAKCEQRQQVIACLNNMDNDKTIVKADDPFDCSKRKNGVYGSGKCSTTYYHCSEGHATEMLCPANLYYNDKLKACDEIDSIDECNLLTALRGFDERREGHLGEKGKYIERNLMSNRDGLIFNASGGYGGGIRKLSLGKEKIESSDRKDKKRPARQTLYQANSWLPGSEMNCTGLKDGAYSMIKDKCTKYFWRCSNGEITGRICQDGLFFNTISGKCDIAANIMHCVNKKKKLITRRAIESNCNATNDGIVESSTCSRFYYNCTAGKFSRCPKEQVFNVRQKRCDNEISVPDCVTVEKTFSTARGNYIETSKIVPSPELSEFCSRNGDGIFSAGCENYFYFCSWGNGYHVNCPEGLFFDSKTKTCNHKENVLLCNLHSKNLGVINDDYASILESLDRDDEEDEMEIYNIHAKKVVHNQPDEIPEVGLPALVSMPISKTKSLPFLPEDFECDRRSDGFYSIGCKTEFVACANNRMFFFECPNDLVFHEDAQICDHLDNIGDCSNIDQKESFSVINAGMDQEISSEEKIEEVDYDTVVSKPNYCKKLSDGIYFNDCGNQYLICNSGASFAYVCPEGQIVDPTSKTCHEPINIPACINE